MSGLTTTSASNRSWLAMALPMILNVCSSTSTVSCTFPKRWFGRDVRSDHEVGPHASRGSYRQRARQTAVDVFVSVDVHRLEQSRNGARRAHRHTGIPALKYDRFAALQVGRDHTDRRAELFQRTILHGLVDEFLQRFAAHEATVRQRPIAERRFLEIQRETLELEAAHTGCIERSDHAAGAGADDDVRTNALRLRAP